MDQLGNMKRILVVLLLSWVFVLVHSQTILTDPIRIATDPNIFAVSLLYPSVKTCGSSSLAYLTISSIDSSTCFGIRNSTANGVNITTCPPEINGATELFCLDDVNTVCYVLNPTLGYIVSIHSNGSVMSTFGLQVGRPKGIQATISDSFPKNHHFVWVADNSNHSMWMFQVAYKDGQVYATYNYPMLRATADVQAFYMNSSNLDVLVSYEGDSKLYRSYRTSSSRPWNITEFNSIDNYGGGVPFIAFDNKLPIIYDLGCNCAKIVDSTNGAVGARIDLIGVKDIAALRGQIYIADGAGLLQFSEKFRATVTTTPISCRTIGGLATVNIEGGVGVYKLALSPDSVVPRSTTGNPSSGSTTNQITPLAYNTSATYSLPLLAVSPAPLILYGSIINPNFLTYTSNSNTSVVTAADMGGNSPTNGETCLQIAFLPGNISQSTFRGTGGIKCRSSNCVQNKKFQKVHLTLNVGNGNQSFTITLGSSFVIHTVTPNMYQNNAWVELELDFMNTTLSVADGIYFNNLYTYNEQSQPNPFYVDDIYLTPLPSDTPRTVTISDDCSVEYVQFHIVEENVFNATIVSTPVTCNIDGINSDLASNGALEVQTFNGQQPFLYNWIFSNSTNATNTVVDNLNFLQNWITVYDNAINSSWGDASSSYTKNFSDTTYFSAPYSFSFAPVEQYTLFSFVSPVMLNMEEYPYIELMVNGGTFGGQQIMLLVHRYFDQVASIALDATIESGLILPGIWQKARFTIPIPTSSTAKRTYDRISLQSNTAYVQDRIYFDDLRITKKPVVTVYDSAGCVVSVPLAQVATPPALTYSQSVQNVKCNGAPDGAVTITVAGGTPYSSVPNYNYSFSGNGLRDTRVLPQRSSLPESKFTVDVSDSHGCGVPTQEITVLQPPPMSLTLLDVQSIQCNGEAATVTASISGGVPPYTYSWASTSTITSRSRPAPESWFSDESSSERGVAITGADRVCWGTGSFMSDISFSPSHSGYCSLNLGNNTEMAVTCNVDSCLDTSKHSGLEFWVYLSEINDASNLAVSITQGNSSFLSVPLPSLATLTSGTWNKIIYNISDSPLQTLDGFKITTAGSIQGSVLFDEIVAIPIASGGAGVAVYTGFENVISGVANSYFLTVVDKNGCKFERTLVIEQPKPLVIEYTMKNTSSTTSSDGAITVNATGGTAPYTYLWIQSNSTSETVSGLDYGASYTVEVTDANGCQIETAIVILSDPDTIVFRKFNKNLAGGMSAVVGFGFVIFAFAAVMFAIYWAVFSPLGSFFCSILLLGALVSYVGALMLLPEPNDHLCMAYPWLMGIAFVLVYGCLFIKTWAIYRVWSKAKEYQKSSLTPNKIVKILVAFLILEIVFLIIWTVVDPPKAEWVKVQNNERELQCNSSSPVFWIIFLSVKGAWLLVGVVLSVMTRDVVKKFNESSSIAYAIYNNVILLVIGIPLGVLLKDVAGGRLVIEIVIPVIAFTSTLIIMFFKYWYNSIMPAPMVPPKTPSNGSRKTTTASVSVDSSNTPPSPSDSRDTTPSEKKIELMVI